MKPKPSPRLIEQARIMRQAKEHKRDFLTRQKNLFASPLDLSKEIAAAEEKLSHLSDEEVFLLSHRLVASLLPDEVHA